MTQQQLADKAGVTQSAISQWLRGESAPKLQHLKALQGALSMTLDEMLGDVTLLDRQDEKELIERYRSLPEDQRKAFLQMLSALCPPRR